MPRNTLDDLNNHLFEQLERLNDCETLEEQEREIERSKEVAKISEKILHLSEIELDAAKLKATFKAEYNEDVPLPLMIEGHHE